MNLYNNDYCILRQDKDGNRFLRTEDALPTAYMNLEKTSKYIRTWVRKDLGLALYLCSGGGDWQNITWKKEPHFRFLSECDKVKSEERVQIRRRLLDFYFESDAMEKLDRRLEELIHYLAVRGFYEKAYDFIRVYGPECVEAKDLVRITTYMLEEGGYEEEILLWYLYTSFVKGKYNTNMLQYLSNHYCGSSKISKCTWLY